MERASRAAGRSGLSGTRLSAAARRVVESGL